MFRNNNPVEKKIPYIIMSVFLAVVLWFFVVSQEDPDINLDFNGIPVVFQGENDVLKAKDLMISSGHSATVNMTLEGKRNKLLSLEKEQIQITVDVSAIAAAGDYSLAYKVTFPANSGITVLEKNRDMINFTVSQVSEKAVPIVGVFSGSIAEGYLAENFVFYPETVQISGIAEEIAQVSHALVTLTGTDVSETLEKDAAFELIDYDGNVLEFESLKFAQPMVHVTLPIVTTAEVPLAVEFIDGGGAKAENITYTISPETVLVSGEPDDLQSLKSIMIGTIDLAKVLDTASYTLVIPLSTGLINQSGIAEAVVTVSVVGLSSKSLVASHIEVINVPDRYDAVALTQSLPVTVRGSEDALKMIFDYNIRIVVDLSGITEATGSYTLPAKVYLDGYGDAGIVGDYKVVVSISK